MPLAHPAPLTDRLTGTLPPQAHTACPPIDRHKPRVPGVETRLQYNFLRPALAPLGLTTAFGFGHGTPASPCTAAAAPRPSALPGRSYLTGGGETVSGQDDTGLRLIENTQQDARLRLRYNV
ncbi:MAG TPA: hypothetical protein DCZ11_11385 [Gammaproteobacteria bacterium]|nr:hypothetical protein [Gammaproteobacteria bacterium]MCH79033.1 hypothetical protein [Gammaproteobacteria bacterium]